MRWVEQPLARPFSCAIVPGRGVGQETDGWIDTLNELPGWDQHVYLSAAGARNVAKFLGWHPPEALVELEEKLGQLQAELDLRERELADQDVVLQAIDTLESAEFRARKKAGRPKQKPKEEAVA